MAKNYPFHRLSLIFPCFNEADNLWRFEKEVFGYFDGVKLPYECILVDDGSTDTTWEVAQSLASKHAGVRLVRHPANRGLGAAVQSGLAAASGDAILTMDADLTFAPSEAMKLIQAYGPTVDSVCGSPLTGEFQNVSFIRQLLSHGVNLCYRVLLAEPLTATTSILRLYRATLVKALTLECTNFDVNAEILLKLLQAGGNVKEVPVTLTTRTLGYSKINTTREIFNHLKIFGKILRWKFKR